MLFRFTNLFVAAGLLVALWALSVVREPGRTVWVRDPGPVRILQFYASVGALQAGDKAQLCYGVENAKAVQIAPPLDDVYPSSNHCVEIVPTHTTHYVILAEGFDGKVAMESFTLLVEKPEPLKTLGEFLDYAAAFNRTCAPGRRLVSRPDRRAAERRG